MRLYGSPAGIRTLITPAKGITVLETGVLPLNDGAVYMVGETGLEPARPFGQRFLRPLRATYFATLP